MLNSSKHEEFNNRCQLYSKLYDQSFYTVCYHFNYEPRRTRNSDVLLIRKVNKNSSESIVHNHGSLKTNKRNLNFTLQLPFWRFSKYDKPFSKVNENNLNNTEQIVGIKKIQISLRGHSYDKNIRLLSDTKNLGRPDFEFRSLAHVRLHGLNFLKS